MKFLNPISLVLVYLVIAVNIHAADIPAGNNVRLQANDGTIVTVPLNLALMSNTLRHLFEDVPTAINEPTTLQEIGPGVLNFLVPLLNSFNEVNNWAVNNSWKPDRLTNEIARRLTAEWARDSDKEKIKNFFNQVRTAIDYFDIRSDQTNLDLLECYDRALRRHYDTLKGLPKY